MWTALPQMKAVKDKWKNCTLDLLEPETKTFDVGGLTPELSDYHKLVESLCYEQENRGLKFL
jgi:hypothetical protein